MMQLSNYLFFTTTCKQALEFYTQCGLGKVNAEPLIGSAQIVMTDDRDLIERLFACFGEGGNVTTYIKALGQGLRYADIA